MRWLSKYLIWLMSYIGFMHAVYSWSLPRWANTVLQFLALIAFFIWDSVDDDKKKEK